MDRRNFLKSAGSAGIISLIGTEAESADHSLNPDGVYGVLTDTTQCIGCRKCEWACNDVNHLPVQPLETFENKSIFQTPRRPDAGHYTIVNQYPGPVGSDQPIWVKFQCLHCNEPACWSACLVTAFTKHENGAVTYDPWRCMGCRYCMVACPFQIPTYEYDNALTPKIQKCTLCFSRISQSGGVPGCVEICPPQCLTFGKRKDLLTLAHNKIKNHPEKYIDQVYGEHEVGGTSWMYVAGKPFTELGLPKLGHEPPAKLTEEIQHGIFKYFMPQAAFFAFLGMIYRLYHPAKETVLLPYNPPPVHQVETRRVEKTLFTRGLYILASLAALGMLVAFIRFLFGLKSITNLNDQYPWGIWIGIDVATGVALAAGGFTTSALAHIFHRSHYAGVVRPALLTALLGYTFVALGLLVDLGRYYNIWHPILPFMWSGHSVLFEVGMCVTFYLTVLYIEFLPIVVERYKGQVHFPGKYAKWNPRVENGLELAERTLGKTMTLFIMAGVLLSCLHQSSLGALMLIAPTKMHPLWYTPILPLLFLLSAISVGYPMVIFESIIASRIFGRKPEMKILTPLSKIIPIILGIYLSFKIGDLVVRDAVPYVWSSGLSSFMFFLEVGIGVIAPLVILLYERNRRSAPMLFTAASLVVFGVAVNRINVFLTAYTPVYKMQAYFPSIFEIIVTIGLISTLILMYRLIVTYFPILPSMKDESI